MQLFERLYSSILGGAIGDALGMPVEGHTAEWIREKFGPDGVTGFSSLVDPGVYGQPPAPAGSTTDDTQQKLVVARSVIMARGWDKFLCGELHVEAYKTSRFGWGGTSVTAVMDLLEGRRTLVLPPPELEPGKGCGNGPPMKVSPLGLWATLTNQGHRLADWCMEMSLITHPDPRAGFAAYATAYLITLITSGRVNNVADARALLPQVIEAVEALEEKYRGFRWNDDRLSARLRQIAPNLGSDRALFDAFGVEGHSMTSVPLSIGLFMRYPFNFRAGVLAAVNAGGDTDTHASIVGDFIGANVGFNGGVPFEWQKGLLNRLEIFDAADGLSKAAKQFSGKEPKCMFCGK